MAKKRYINTVFWDDYYISNLDPSEKLVFIYLITNPCTNICGVYQITIKRISMDTGLEKEMIIKILERFQRDNKILYSDGWIAIRNFIKHQNFGSEKIKIGIDNELSECPEELKEFINIPYIYHIDNVSKSQSISKSLSISKSFIIPEIFEIKEYLKEIGENRFSADEFHNFYSSKGWMIGKNKMKNWKAAVRTWQKRCDEKGGSLKRIYNKLQAGNK